MTDDNPGVRVQGWDVSLNHAAMVELTDGEMTDFRYVTTTAADAKASPNGARINVEAMKKSTGKDRHRWALLRLVEMSKHVWSWAEFRPDYIGLEDYAVRAEQGAHYLGEIGGLSRLHALEFRVPLRLHDPGSVKMFVAHNGNAPKEVVEAAVRERWGMDFGKYNRVKGRTTSEDLADAYAIARMVWCEVELRRGTLDLSSLHEKEIRVFHRVTKSQPICLLEREWIRND